MDTFRLVPISQIVERLPVRKVQTAGIERLRQSIRSRGLLDNYPLTLFDLGNNTYKLIDGNHRLEAAIAEGLAKVHAIVKANVSDQDAYTYAFRSNGASEAYVPNTLVTFAEFVQARTLDKYTQKQIGDMLGWSQQRVQQYEALQKLARSAWKIITTTFELDSETHYTDTVVQNTTGVVFTEGLLRSILDLRAPQQFSLVQQLANEDIKKARFKTLAESYTARNAMQRYAIRTLGDVGITLIKKACSEIAKGNYDDEFKEHKCDGPRLTKLIEAIRDEWEEKNGIQLHHGDFNTVVKKVGDGSIDLIITDPPYNVSNERTFVFEGRTNISQDFGEWDKHEHTDFIAEFAVWARECFRLLRNKGSGYIFTSDSYISHLREALETAGLDVRATIVWHKTNPGTQVVKTNFRSSVEYILFFTKGEQHTFNWQGENEMHNFIESPICGGNERLVNGQKNTLHPTQKPEAVIRHLMEISSVKGDTVFDGFMGVGTTGKVARDLGRKFLGIEQDQTYFEAAQWRITGTSERKVS